MTAIVWDHPQFTRTRGPSTGTKQRHEGVSALSLCPKAARYLEEVSRAFSRDLLA
jgi:hypothetical protein